MQEEEICFRTETTNVTLTLCSTSETSSGFPLLSLSLTSSFFGLCCSIQASFFLSSPSESLHRLCFFFLFFLVFTNSSLTSSLLFTAFQYSFHSPISPLDNPQKFTPTHLNNSPKMGCSQSKIENEEAVSRCKDRKAFMKVAVTSRNAFAAAHSSYAMSLKNAGAALSDFAQGEILNPPSLSSSQAGPTSGVVVGPAPIAAQPPPTLPPPPPPVPDTDMPVPLQRAVSMPEFVSKPGVKPVTEDTIEEEEEEEEEEDLRRRRREGNKGGSVGGRIETANSNSNSNTNVVGPPPSPPPPEERERERERERESRTPPPPSYPIHDQTWDYFFNPDMPNVSLSDEVEYQQHTVYHQRAMRSSGSQASVTTTLPPSIEVVEEMVMPEMPPMPPTGGGGGRVVKKGKQVVGQGGSGGEGRRKNVNLVQLFSDLDDCFLKASESAYQVSKMLEATRLHYHSNFADNRGIFLFFAFKRIELYKYRFDF